LNPESVGNWQREFKGNTKMKSLDKRLKILASTEEIVSEKGLSDTTISEIAKAAGVADSIIYQHFKGKDDIVFSIPAEREKEFFSLLTEHLEGIRDSESRLSKILWCYLRYCDTHPGYAKILYFDCLSSMDFYQSRGYEPIRRYARILLDCLERGVEQGQFRDDVDMHLVRDIVLGLIGCELLSFLAVGEIDAVPLDLEHMMRLIRGMLKPRTENEEGKGDRILKAAERIFAEKGYYKARLAEIAKLAGVAEGTVYEYFGNKETLLLSIPDRHFRRYMQELPEVFEIRNPIRKLRRFIKYYFSLFSNERDFLKTFLIQIQLSRRFYRTEHFEGFVNFFRIIEQIIEEGKAQGCFRRDVNPRVFRNMFIGTFNNLTLRWFILQRDRQIDKMLRIDEVTNLLCAAVTVKDDN
jgi:TetR/AcrR family fatty acid metabolism transcriptional regulator